MDGRDGYTVHTDRGEDARAADRRRARVAPRARRGREHPAAGRSALPRPRGTSVRVRATTSRSGSIAATSPPATAGASPPAASCASASAPSIPGSTSASPPSGWPPTSAPTRVRYQGNWIPHALREATEDGVFFAGDSAGHCLPLTAEGIRTALYFGIACGRELRAVVAGQQTREQALARYHAFSAGHACAVPLDAAGAAAGPARGAAAARRRAARDAGQALRRLVVRPLPQHRAPAVRRTRIERTLTPPAAALRWPPAWPSAVAGSQGRVYAWGSLPCRPGSSAPRTPRCPSCRWSRSDHPCRRRRACSMCRTAPCPVCRRRTTRCKRRSARPARSPLALKSHAPAARGRDGPAKDSESGSARCCAAAVVVAPLLLQRSSAARRSPRSRSRARRRRAPARSSVDAEIAVLVGEASIQALPSGSVSDSLCSWLMRRECRIGGAARWAAGCRTGSDR